VPAQGGSPGGPSRLPAATPAQDLQARLTAELEQERHVALELQRAILPLHDGPFDLPGLRAVVRYLPATRGSRVGGDWYITAAMPTGQVLIAIGDVAGHGLAAAAGMARLRGALAGLAITGAPPERLVGWLNDCLGRGRLLRPGYPRAHLGAGRPSPARAGPGRLGGSARSARRDPARRGRGRLRGRVPAAPDRRPAPALQ
jgi:hypothetical protein